MLCRDFREIADSYLSDELLIETNHDVISHLESCADCRREMAARRELREKLRSAFVHAPELQVRAEFSDRLMAKLSEVALGQERTGVTSLSGRSSANRRRNLWLAIAACLLVAAGVSLIVVRQKAPSRPQVAATEQHQPETKPAGKDPLGANGLREVGPRLPVNIARLELAKFAVGDHRNCAIEFRLHEKPLPLEEAGRRFDPVYINLAKAVLSGRDGLPTEAELVEAHSCVFEGRRFGHLVFKSHGRIVSLLVTDLQGKETNAGAPPQSGASQDQITACSQLDGYQVSCFETAYHAVFVVSDLPQNENLAFARTVAPSVLAHLSRTEGI